MSGRGHQGEGRRARKLPSRPLERTVGQKCVKQSWDCSQVENEQEEEEEVWQEENQMELHWAADERLEKIVDRRRMERNSLQAEVMQEGTGAGAARKYVPR